MLIIYIEKNGDIVKEGQYYIVPFIVRLDTVAGELSLSDFKVSLTYENNYYAINWKEDLIFSQMRQGDKIRIETIKTKRGSILDR